jgi:hypothetical protein
MLIIRNEQMKAFEAQQMRDFRRRLHQHLSGLLPQPAAPDRVWAEVDALLEKAPDFHIKRESDIARLGTLLCSHFGGISNANLSRDALRILYDYGMDPSRKLDLFEQWLSPPASPGEEVR